ncbi:Rrf2 family transcriptional regulator [Longimicrobium terrae]|uniref:Rrf2 family protein n=1 Tax=Longimicrobium terrae TaxID=1639882 RepID=A0A841GZF2_9BACT|nr:Rrf2 family transcriptional regulator [Longimicrobium terrae]MBB4636867.1 Rrf2 family protein [Longimicrobium terrae]MBB6071133.1 Rrf2 family protein [Longimicrobium terrae]NNC29182.1 Rrf2 family transcriptional regulator [Longimicrobium terrae]
MAATTRFAIAVHAATALAHRAQREGTAWVGSPALAESIGTNPVVVRRIVMSLAGAGLIESQPGRGGGSRLARPAKAITLADIYRAVEGGNSPVLAHNPNPTNPGCAVSCSMHDALAPVFTEVDAAVESALDRTTLADVVARVRPPPARV